jgi:hypothetical protein
MLDGAAAPIGEWGDGQEAAFQRVRAMTTSLILEHGPKAALDALLSCYLSAHLAYAKASQVQDSLINTASRVPLLAAEIDRARRAA